MEESTLSCQIIVGILILFNLVATVLIYGKGKKSAYRQFNLNFKIAATANAIGWLWLLGYGAFAFGMLINPPIAVIVFLSLGFFALVISYGEAFMLLRLKR